MMLAASSINHKRLLVPEMEYQHHHLHGRLQASLYLVIPKHLADLVPPNMYSHSLALAPHKFLSLCEFEIEA